MNPQELPDTMKYRIMFWIGIEDLPEGMNEVDLDDVIEASADLIREKLDAYVEITYK